MLIIIDFVADPCFYNGSCSNTDGSYKCNCTSAKTGKNCELQKAACDNNPCKNSEICALSERSSGGFQCVDKQLEMVMDLAGDKRPSVFDLEKEIENLIKSAPNNANAVSARHLRLVFTSDASISASNIRRRSNVLFISVFC